MAVGDQTHKETAVASDGKFWISRVLALLSQLDKDTKHVTPLIPIGDQKGAPYGEAQKTLEKLGKVASLPHLPFAYGYSPDLSERSPTTRIGKQQGVSNSCWLLSSFVIVVEKRITLRISR